MLINFFALISQPYSTLNSWLQKSDENYFEGRLLWMSMCINGASNLLWLACEQIIKILLLQKQIEHLSKDSQDLNVLHEKVNEEAKKIRHNTKKLMSKVSLNYPHLDISEYEEMLHKLNEYFYRRYVVNKGSTIELHLLKKVDEFYFLLRSNIHPDVGVGIIDEIFIQKKHNWGHPIAAFAFAYIQNDSFAPCSHREFNQMGPDGKIYKENGSNDIIILH